MDKIYNDKVKERLDRQVEFCREIDKEKFIGRQTYKTDGETRENDAEHAWHMAIMALILGEYSNEEIDVLRTISMLLIHDIVEIDAGDTYAYDEEGKKTQKERELKAANRIFNILPEDQANKFMDIWLEFEECKTAEAKFARTLDNFQPIMLNSATDGKAWVENKVKLSQILKRNSINKDGATVLGDYLMESFVEPNLKAGRIKDE